MSMESAACAQFCFLGGVRMLVRSSGGVETSIKGVALFFRGTEGTERLSGACVC